MPRAWEFRERRGSGVWLVSFWLNLSTAYHWLHALFSCAFDPAPTQKFLLEPDALPSSARRRFCGVLGRGYSDCGVSSGVCPTLRKNRKVHTRRGGSAFSSPHLMIFGHTISSKHALHARACTGAMIPAAVECAFKKTGHCSTCAKSAQAGGFTVWFGCCVRICTRLTRTMRGGVWAITGGSNSEVKFKIRMSKADSPKWSGFSARCTRALGYLCANTEFPRRRNSRVLHKFEFPSKFTWVPLKNDFYLSWCAARAHSVTFVSREFLSGPSQFLSRPTNFSFSPPFHLEHPILPCTRFTPGRPLGPPYLTITVKIILFAAPLRYVPTIHW